MYLCITPKLGILEVFKSGWLFSTMDMMRRDQKFFIQALNIHFQIYFKVLPLRNMLKC